MAHAPRVSRPELKVFTPEQAKVFLEALQGERLEPLFTVSVASGLRLGEMLGLRWVDVDLESGTVRVHQALQRVGKTLRFVEPKSERSRRSVALPSFALEVLNRQQERQRGERLLAGSRWAETRLVFTTTIGTPLDERNVRRVFKAMLEAAGLPALRIHDLRHTTATLLLTQEVHPRVVMETLGHSQISLTLDTYSHVLPGLQAEAAHRMQEALGENGCQTETSVSADEHELQNSEGKVVSRLGIEPRTRRLREIGRASSGVRPSRSLQNFEQFESARVHGFCICPTVRGSVRGSSLR